jgi:Family of unknown function (DUF5709)
MTDDFPRPVSDPEAEGLPGVADDDSTAEDDVNRAADGADPAALPLDRDERPLGLDHYGTTPAEVRQGEPLDVKLAREVPDEPPEAPAGDPDPVGEDLDAVDELLDEAPVAASDSDISVYDDGAPRPVGRLVEPDAGSWQDDEPDAIAEDAGAAGGGPSAEEAAVHERRDIDV